MKFPEYHHEYLDSDAYTQVQAAQKHFHKDDFSEIFIAQVYDEKILALCKVLTCYGHARHTLAHALLALLLFT